MKYVHNKFVQNNKEPKMKNFKILFMLAGFSTLAVASEETPGSQGLFNDAMNLVSKNAASVAKSGSECGAYLVNGATGLYSTAAKSASDLSTSVVKNTTELSSAAMKSVSELGSSVSTKASDITTSVMKSGSECGSYVAKNASDLSASAMKNASVLKDTTVKFYENNETAVKVTAAVAAILAVTAIVRYNVYGYVFYKSVEADNNNN